MLMENFLSSIKWTLAGKVSIPPSEARYFPIQDLKLSNASKKLLQTFDKGIYLHQKEAIRLAKEGKTYALVQGQHQGKHLPFKLLLLKTYLEINLRV